MLKNEAGSNLHEKGPIKMLLLVCLISVAFAAACTLTVNKNTCIPDKCEKFGDTEVCMQLKTTSSVPIPGTPCPDFEVEVLTPELKFTKRKLADYKGKYLIIFFYPADFTFVCPSEIIHFSSMAEQLKKKYNTEIIIGSTDTVYSHHAWCLQNKTDGGIGPCKCDLFADTNHKMARDFGILVEEMGLALRAMFIVSDKGIVRHVTINDFPVGRSVEEAMRMIQAFQYADKTGGVIPCGWTPEKNDFIIPDPEKKKEYFSKTFTK